MSIFLSIFYWLGSLRNGLALSYRIYIHLFHPLLTYLVMFVYHLQNVFGKCGWKVNGTCPFGSMIQTEIRVPFLESRLQYQFQAFAADFWQMANAIPGRNLPALNSAYHLLKPWTNRITHVNVQLPLSTISFCLGIRLWLMKVSQLSLRNGK